MNATTYDFARSYLRFRVDLATVKNVPLTDIIQRCIFGRVAQGSRDGLSKGYGMKHVARLAAAALYLCLAVNGEGSVYYVDGLSGDDTHAGTAGWADAVQSVTTALARAVAPAEIWVTTGVYRPTADGNRTRSFVMKDGVDLYGGFAGTETTRGQRDWTNNATILCGDIGTPGDMTDNSYHVVVGATARIDGFIIRNGRTGGSGSNLNGAGMYSTGVGPITANCIFSNNYAFGGLGGGVYWSQGAYAAQEVGWHNCTFVKNVAAYDAHPRYGKGAGLYLHFYTNTVGAISNCLFYGNLATNSGATASALYLYDYGQKDWGSGGAFEVVSTVFSNNPTIGASNNDPGGVYVERFVAPVVFRDCRFAANTNTFNVASRGGGAMGINIPSHGQGVRMIRCVFDRNHSGNTAGAVIFMGTGGGTNSYWRDCTFTGNTAGAQAGAIYGPLDGTFDGCHFVGNACLGYADGGAIRVSAGGAVSGDLFTNCVFRSNRVTTGNAGALSTAAPLALRDCRFEGNQAPSWSRGGGAVRWQTSGTGTGVIENCVFVTNTAAGVGGGIWLETGTLAIRGTTFAGNAAGSYYATIGGGGIGQTGGGEALIFDCTFVSNSATGHGGAICQKDYVAPIGEWAQPGPGFIEQCVFSGNQVGASRYGGAMTFSSFSNYPGRVLNCVFRGNRSGRGGAIATENAPAAIANVTAVGNTSTTEGYGGALAHNGTDCAAQVVNSIFWDNSPSEIAPTDGVTVRYSNVDGGFAGTGNRDADPLFADLVHLHLKSITGYYANGYFAGGTWQTAETMSPCIDAGDPASDWSREPKPRTGRINLGAYGNTEVASMGLHPGSLFLVR